MTDLLIHSMKEFQEIILPSLAAAGARDIVEIGAEFGGMSQLLADHVAAHGGWLTSIDPAPKAEFTAWLAGRPEVRHLAALSHDAIGQTKDVDAWVIDGDHNWYTVYHELRAIRAACTRDGKPMLAFLHDVNWPSGRRDMYYAPETIPAEFRHDYSFEGGCFPGNSQLFMHRGFRGMGGFAWATHEGGPRNGVLTAVEDFLADALAEGQEYLFAEVPGVFGLGVVFAMDADWSEEVASIVLPYHDNHLLRRLEQNRLANYLTIIEWQDRGARAA